MILTAKELATNLGVEYGVAAAILKLGVAQGHVQLVGYVKTSASGKGKPSAQYEVPDTLTFNMTKSMVNQVVEDLLDEAA
jgi:hypothetical protein